MQRNWDPSLPDTRLDRHGRANPMGWKWYEWIGYLIVISVMTTLYFGGLAAPLFIWVFVYPGWWIWPAVFIWPIAWILFWAVIDERFL